MTTKKAQAKGILKYVPEPTSRDIYRISKDVGCSERTVWRALYELRGDRKEEAYIVRMLLGLYSILHEKYDKNEKPLTLKDEKLLDEIEAMLGVWSSMVKAGLGKKMVMPGRPRKVK